ncbi:MAG: hypothetical protein HYX77_00360, partial [Acidobacteria bacterium]|nr:hypothetical protein [Acidobacteriota bacterium]
MSTEIFGRNLFDKLARPSYFLIVRVRVFLLFQYFAVTIGTRIIRTPRGSALWCGERPLEAPLHMLVNNLDRDVAVRPGDPIVFGSSGRARRNWP